MSRDAQPGLRHDLSGRIQQFGQVVDRTHQSATTPARRRVVLAAGAQFGGLGLGPAHRPLGVGEQPLGVAYRGFGQLGQLTGARQHRGLGLLAA
jgi:hypothetical protein